MKDKLLNDDYIIAFIEERQGKQNNETITNTKLNHYRMMATTQEVIKDLAKIADKYKKVIEKKFFKDDMTDREKEHTAVKAVFEIFYHRYIQQYPDNEEVCIGIVDALNHYRYSLENKINGKYVNLLPLYLRKTYEYFDCKYLTYWFDESKKRITNNSYEELLSNRTITTSIILSAIATVNHELKDIDSLPDKIIRIFTDYRKQFAKVAIDNDISKKTISERINTISADDYLEDDILFNLMNLIQCGDYCFIQ